MGPGPAAEGETNLELAYRLIPPTGNNWGEVAKRGAAEAEFLDRVRPLVHPDFDPLAPLRDARGDKGRAVTGDDFAEEGAAMYIFEASQLRRLELYSDRAIALADAGITEAEARERGVPVEDIA